MHDVVEAGMAHLRNTDNPEVLNFFVLEIEPEIVDLGGLNGPLLPGNLMEKMGGEAPHLFQ